ncbi:MAG: hypothetical protein HQK67_12190 [Desulfamplus sp.]|nr:hypothetical protein [Desulfamplus sp.]
MKSCVWFSIISFVMILHLSSFVLAQDNKTVEAPTVKVGDSYKFETENISNTKLSYISVREITAINGNRMTVVTTNEKSGNKRTNYYDLAWGYLGSGVDGKDGVSLSPALKYLDFPLSVGKKWTAQSVETNNKTKNQRYHTINGTVEGWEKVSVPAGEFDALKIVLQTEVKDGDKVNIGNDISWYVPALKRSIKSELTGKDASTGVEEKKNIRLLSYHVEPDYDEDNPDANEPPEGNKAEASVKTAIQELYLSIKGCQGTILKINGLNSSNASVIAEVKRPNAEEYCERMRPANEQEECIKQTLDEEKGNFYSSTADCKNKTISISHLGKFTMVSHSLKDGNIEYVWRDEESGEILDGSSASESDVVDSQFDTLCPAFKETKDDEVSKAQNYCSEFEKDHVETMEKLAIAAKLPDGYFSRYHESVVSELCGGDVKNINELVDIGYVKAKEAEAIAAVLGKQYKAPPRSEQGRLYEKTYLKLLELGDCDACASNHADEYVKNPNGSVGKLVKAALSGDKDALTKLNEPDNADEVAAKEKEKQDTSNIRVESISPIPAPLTPETIDKIARAMIPLIRGKDVKNDPVLSREAIIKSFNKYGYNFSKTVENIADDPLYAQSNGAWTGFILAVTPETEEQIKSVYTKEEAAAILNLRKAMKAYK